MALRQYLRKLRYGQPLIVVSGLPRSGTSMAMKMLQAGGLSTVVDEQRQADEDNPNGYFEDERVLRLAEDGDREWLRGARGKAIKIIAYLLPYLPETNNYKVIFMERDLEEVLASQSKMLDRRGETNETDDASMTELYEGNLDKVKFQLRFRECFDTHFVHYRQAIENPRAAAQALRDFLDLPLDVDAMAAVVDRSLYRNRAS
jgi:hypothetical protein